MIDNILQSSNSMRDNFPRDIGIVLEAVEHIEGAIHYVNHVSDHDKDRIHFMMGAIKSQHDKHWFHRYIFATCDIIEKLVSLPE